MSRAAGNFGRMLDCLQAAAASGGSKLKAFKIQHVAPRWTSRDCSTMPNKENPSYTPHKVSPQIRLLNVIYAYIGLTKADLGGTWGGGCIGGWGGVGNP